MTFVVNGGICKLVREKGERFRNSSQVFFQLRNLMRGAGYDVVKRNMEQDGHLMGDRHTYYVRDRRGRFAVYDGDYAIRDTARDLNEHGMVLLTFHHWNEVKGGC